jgi:Xaa-Pro aminopeptidase
MDTPSTIDRIPLSEHAERRGELRAALKDAIGLVFAGEADAHASEPFRPHAHFEYLTGVVDEPAAVLLLDPAHPTESRRDMLFLRPLNPEIEKWDGYRQEIASALRERTGCKTIFRLDKLPMLLNESVRRARRVTCLHPLANYTQPVSPDLERFRRVAERIPGVDIVDHSLAIPAMRSAKSKHEIAMIERAIDITAAGYSAVLESLAPGMNEFDVQEIIEHAYRTTGARRTAYRTIAGGGLNSTVLHYHDNNQPLGEDDLICIDSGAAVGGYCADITRTLPVGGRFNPRQREVYDVVLAAEQAAIKACKAGETITAIDKVARDIITRAGFGDHFIHGIGHHLGLEVHDAAPPTDVPLRAGAVITIEPGIYIPDEKIGIRIEDDVLITRTGSKVLSADIPRSAEDIEKLMGRGKRT